MWKPNESTGKQRERRSKSPLTHPTSPLLQSLQYSSSPPVKRQLLASGERSIINKPLEMTLLDTDSEHRIFAYGNPLPVLVTEVITASARPPNTMSARLESNGWASLVCGRHLFIWKFRDNDFSTLNIIAQCKELTLPASDLAHRADLVQVILTQDSVMPAVLAVSPEGLIRYWPNISQEARVIAATADLQGQECYSLIDVNPMGYILATTTGSLILIKLCLRSGQHQVICRTVRLPQGVLAGMGQKVTSFIFGSLPSQPNESKQMKVLATVGTKSISLYVLNIDSLQKWKLTETGPDQLIFEHDLERLLIGKFNEAFWVETDSKQVLPLKVWCLDMQFIRRDKIAILTAATNLIWSKYVRYALMILEVSNDQVLGVSSFSMINKSEEYQEYNEEWIFKFRLMMPAKGGHYIYMYSHSQIFCISISETNKDSAIIDAQKHEWGEILGAGCHGHLPVFFTQHQGLLALQSERLSLENRSFAKNVEQETTIEKDKNEEARTLGAKLKTVMCQFYNNEIERYQESLKELFPDSVPQAYANLDETVVYLSQQIINDLPVSDPRWCDSVPSDCVSSSLIIYHQLEDKLKVHEYLINFLKAVGLYEKLGTYYSLEGELILTKNTLSEHGEKLIAAKTIRRLLFDYKELLNEMILKYVATYKNRLGLSNLTHTDIFFREVSQIQTLFKQLSNHVFSLPMPESPSEEENSYDLISSVNIIFMEVLRDILQYRKDKVGYYNSVPFDEDNMIHYKPWTCKGSPHGLRDAMLRLVNSALEVINKNSSYDLPKKDIILAQIIKLIDIVLSEDMCEMESARKTDQFQAIKERFTKERKRLLNMLIDAGKRDTALAFAEKFLDFEIIMELCEDMKKPELVQKFIVVLKEKGFVQFMLKWYIDKGMKKRIFEYSIDDEDLITFLKDHGDLSWLFDVKDGRFATAAQSLKDGALSEKNLCHRRKTLLSLAKLAEFAAQTQKSYDENHIKDLDYQLDHILHIERLPDTVVISERIDPEKVRFYGAEELIEMYIGEKNPEKDLDDFKTALDVLYFFPKPPGHPDYERLRCHIWCKSILEDNWTNMDASNPTESIQVTVFFRLAQLAFRYGHDLDTYLLPLQQVLDATELKDFAKSQTNVHYLRVAYEMIHRLAHG